MPDPSSSSPAPAPAHAAVSPEERHPHSLVVRIWPNIPILYPMALAALVCGILSMFFSFDGAISRLAEAPVAVAQTAAVEGGDAAAATAAAGTGMHTVDPAVFAKQLRAGQVIAVAFLAAFTYTLVVVCTDIVLTGALIGILLSLVVGLVMFIANIYYQFLPGLFGFLTKFTPVANAQFYFAISAVWVVLMIGAVMHSRFHYVKIESNEVVFVGGMLDKRKRYSSMRMQYTKEICDVFEYYLPFVRSGRLILRFPQEDEPVILDHVMHIDRVVKQLDHITATLQVAPEDRGPEADA
jgi:hypothetical protein